MFDINNLYGLMQNTTTLEAHSLFYS